MPVQQFAATRERVSNHEAGIELAALGNATIEGDAFSARALRVAYAKAKELVILEGDGRVDAELWRKGSTTPDFAAQQIRFWTTNQSIQVDGGRYLNLGGIDMPLALPKRYAPPVATWAEITSRILGLCRIAATDRSRGFQPTEINRKNRNKSRSDD